MVTGKPPTGREKKKLDSFYRFQIFRQSNWETINFCCVKPLSLWYFVKSSLEELVYPENLIRN